MLYVVYLSYKKNIYLKKIDLIPLDPICLCHTGPLNTQTQRVAFACVHTGVHVLVLCVFFCVPKHMLHSGLHVGIRVCVCVCAHALTHTHTQGAAAAARVNGVFDWNRMTVGIHAGFPLLNSAIRLTVYGSADVPAHLGDLLPVCVCVGAKNWLPVHNDV